ncbi:unnamed protein product [Paramecium sonneborni]|uniref:Uncharacterized protein n=1 Tax=Paramecium sonneborni TaxID=65129 RepID=A0A8S1KDF9_9CILI|nr:unnamed protein product [Paramecium sonneborni]
MGAGSPISKQKKDEKKKIITFCDRDKPDNQSLQSMLITQETKINDIINYIKQKNGAQNVTLFYDQYEIEDNQLLLYNYLELLPTRRFDFKIHQAQQQIQSNQNQINKAQITTNNQQKNTQTNQMQYHQGTSNQNANFNQKEFQNINQNNTSSLIQNFDKQQQPQQMSQSQQNPKIVSVNQQDNTNYQNNENLEQKQILLYLLSLAQYKIQGFQKEVEELQKNNQNLQQRIEGLQTEKKILEEELKNKQFSYNIELTCNLLKTQQQETLKWMDSQKSNITSQNKLNNAIDIEKSKITFKNQCNHILEENKIQQILIKSLENKTIAQCDQCKPKLSNNILIKMGFIGQTYKEFQASYEIAQLYLNLQQNSKFQLYQCQQNFCSFFFIWNEKFDKQKMQSYLCPMCLQNQFQKIK